MDRPALKSCFGLISVSLGVRLALLLAALAAAESVDVLLSYSDAGSFLRVARRIYLGPEFAETASGYHSRVFPGWPLLFGWAGWLGLETVGLFSLALVLAAAVPCLFRHLSGDRNLAWLLCFVTPAWLVYSTYPMSEAAFLAAGLGSVAALRRRRLLVAGLLLGTMATIRPHAAALLAGQALVLWRDRAQISGKKWTFYGIGLATMPLIALLLNLHLYADPLHQLRVYSADLSQLNVSQEAATALGGAGGHWGPPFYWLIRTPRLVPTPLSKELYIYAHLAALVVLAGVAIRDLLGTRQGELGLAMRVWFLVNSALIVCTGPYWAFHSFDRYFLWAWPAGLWILGERVRLSRAVLVLLSTASLSAATFLLLKN